MCGKRSRRRTQGATCDGWVAASLAVLLAAGTAATPARAEGLWDSLLETMNVKATPAGPGPDFVERTRPDPAGLSYLPTALPHKVSPVAVKGTAEIQAKKDALDAAKTRQLSPGAPVQIAKTAPPGAVKPAAKRSREPRPAQASPAQDAD